MNATSLTTNGDEYISMPSDFLAPFSLSLAPVGQRVPSGEGCKLSSEKHIQIEHPQPFPNTTGIFDEILRFFGNVTGNFILAQRPTQ